MSLVPSTVTLNAMWTKRWRIGEYDKPGKNCRRTFPPCKRSRESVKTRIFPSRWDGSTMPFTIPIALATENVVNNATPTHPMHETKIRRLNLRTRRRGGLPNDDERSCILVIVVQYATRILGIPLWPIIMLVLDRIVQTWRHALEQLPHVLKADDTLFTKGLQIPFPSLNKRRPTLPRLFCKANCQNGKTHAGTEAAQYVCYSWPDLPLQLSING